MHRLRVKKRRFESSTQFNSTVRRIVEVNGRSEDGARASPFYL